MTNHIASQHTKIDCETAALCRCPRLTRSQTAASDIYTRMSTFMPSACIPVHVCLRFVGLGM